MTMFYRLILWGSSLATLASCAGLAGLDAFSDEPHEPGEVGGAPTAPADGGDGSGGQAVGAGGNLATGGGTGGRSEGGADPGPGYRRAFVTAAAFDGALGGLTGADAACAASAGALGGGGWRAWLSDGDTVVDERLANVGPWLSLDGTTTIATSLEDMANGPSAPLVEDELGNAVAGEVWTGTSFNGAPAAAADHCSGWQSPNAGQLGLVGRLGEPGLGFTDYDSNACSQTAHLYCLEQ